MDFKNLHSYFRSLIVAIFLVTAPLNAVSLAQADEAKPQERVIMPWHPELGTSSSADEQSPFLRLGQGLAICLGVFFIGIYGYKKLYPGRVVGGKSRMKVIERLSLSSRSAVILVEVDGAEIVLGVGSEPPTILSKRSKSDEFDLKMYEESQLNIPEYPCAVNSNSVSV